MIAWVHSLNSVHTQPGYLAVCGFSIDSQTSEARSTGSNTSHWSRFFTGFVSVGFILSANQLLINIMRWFSHVAAEYDTDLYGFVSSQGDRREMIECYNRIIRVIIVHGIWDFGENRIYGRHKDVVSTDSFKLKGLFIWKLRSLHLMCLTSNNHITTLSSWRGADLRQSAWQIQPQYICVNSRWWNTEMGQQRLFTVYFRILRDLCNYLTVSQMFTRTGA
jgi:hypothetical protein